MSVLTTKEDILLTRDDIANFTAEIKKWMFIFWVGQVAVTLGIVAVFFNK